MALAASFFLMDNSKIISIKEHICNGVQAEQLLRENKKKQKL
jgi:hypothetical protein